MSYFSRNNFFEFSNRWREILKSVSSQHLSPPRPTTRDDADGTASDLEAQIQPYSLQASCLFGIGEKKKKKKNSGKHLAERQRGLEVSCRTRPAALPLSAADPRARPG